LSDWEWLQSTSLNPNQQKYKTTSLHIYTNNSDSLAYYM